MFFFRPNTLDQSIFEQVNHENEYRLPKTFRSTDVVIDIGAHIGSFAHAVLKRGAGHVYAFEPDPESFELAHRNNTLDQRKQALL